MPKGQLKVRMALFDNLDKKSLLSFDALMKITSVEI